MYPNWKCFADTTAVAALGHGYCALDTPDAAF
jgi:hypothetical protein